MDIILVFRVFFFHYKKEFLDSDVTLDQKWSHLPRCEFRSLRKGNLLQLMPWPIAR